MLHRYILLAVLVTSTACARAAISGRADTAPGLAGAETLLSDRLFFGRNVPGGGQVSDSALTGAGLYLNGGKGHVALRVL